MDFEAKTTIWFSRTGIDEQNKVVLKTQEELFNFITDNRHIIGRSEDCSFQRADGYFTMRIDNDQITYYNLLRADTVMYMNDEVPGCFYIVGNIISVEWKNPNCSFVNFKIDWFMTYQTAVDWSKTVAYLEREHVVEDWTADSNPAFANIGPAEDFNVLPDTPIWHTGKFFNPTMVMITSPYNKDGKAVFDGDIRGGMYSSLQVKAVEASEANDVFTTIANLPEASINNIVGVEAFPSEWLQFLAQGTDASSGDIKMPNLKAVHIAAKENPAVPDYRNSKCWSSPYTVIRIMSSDGDSLDFNPQWFGGNTSEYVPMLRVSSCGGMFGGAAFTLKHTNEGIFDWNYWQNFSIMIRQLPKCPWTADQYTDWAAVNMKHLLASGAVNIARGVVGVASNTVYHPPQTLDFGAGGKMDFDGYNDPGWGAANSVLNTISALNNIAATIGQHKATGAAINGGGGGNLFDIGNASWGFKVVYYQAQPYLMNSIDNYFDRFGYRVNRLKNLTLENRPIWTFLKTHECHVTLKTGGGIPYIGQLAINNMFNRGVTMWRKDPLLGSRRIGDFSKPEENKAPPGGFKA